MVSSRRFLAKTCDVMVVSFRETNLLLGLTGAKKGPDLDRNIARLVQQKEFFLRYILVDNMATKYY